MLGILLKAFYCFLDFTKINSWLVNFVALIFLRATFIQICCISQKRVDLCVPIFFVRHETLSFHHETCVFSVKTGSSFLPAISSLNVGKHLGVFIGSFFPPS